MKTKRFQPLAALHCPLRNSMIVFLSTITFAGATLIDFDLSPTGTSAAVGLRPANEAPAVGGTTGSGNVVSGGITFDTTTSTLSFAMGYGSAAGFTDLTGAATSMHIHGPAAAGVNAAVLFNLAPVHFPAAIPAKGGVIVGSVVYTPSQAADLLAGRDYVNIHTSTNPGGELRGQLVRVNAAPDVICPANATVECGVPVTFSATVSDVDGDAVHVAWALNGALMQSTDITAGGPPTSTVVSYTVSLPDGINTLSVIATDSLGNVTTCSSTITTVDTIAPVIVATSTDPKSLWPVNHKMVAVKVSAEVTDACGPTTWKILSVSSNQAADAKGSGNTAPDWIITGDHTVSLRAERSGKEKSGRVYTITLQATDEAGNLSTPTSVTVVVAHDQGKKS